MFRAAAAGWKDQAEVVVSAASSGSAASIPKIFAKSFTFKGTGFPAEGPHGGPPPITSLVRLKHGNSFSGPKTEKPK